MTFRYKAVLFDNDNTAQRTEMVAFGVVAEVLNEYFERKGLSHRVQALPMQKRYAGDQMTEICRHLFGELGVTTVDAEITAIAEENKRRTVPAMREKSEPSPGMVQAATQLQQSGYDLIMVTSSEIGRVQAGLDKTGLNQFFNKLDYEGGNVFTVPNSLANAGLAAVPKPDPAVYNLTIQQRGYTKNDAVAIEDSASGVKAAVAAGIDVIGYTGADPLNDEERAALTAKLKAAGAKVVIHHMDHLLTVVRAMESRKALQLHRDLQNQNT